MSTKQTGWAAVAIWSVVIALLAAGLISSLAILLIPLSLVLIFIASRRTRAWPEALGGIAGAGVLAALIAVAHFGETPCSSIPQPQILAPGEQSRCGGFPVMPWFTVGAALVLTGIGGYLVARKRA